MTRPRVLRIIGKEPAATYYKPQGIPLRQLAEVTLPVEGLEALRLADALGLDQETAAQSMGVSKPTLCRILAEARSAVATALSEGYALRIQGGNYVVATEAGVDGGKNSRKRCRQCGAVEASTTSPGQQED